MNTRGNNPHRQTIFPKKRYFYVGDSNPAIGELSSIDYFSYNKYSE